MLAGLFERHTAEIAVDSPLAALTRRETAVSLVQTTLSIVAWIVALALALVIVTGAHGVSTIAGASFVAVIIGFATQRFLIDVIAGLAMYLEGWFQVGSSIVIEPWNLEGVVEEVSLRATAIREVSGALVRVSNSQIPAVRVLPSGGHHVDIELFVRDAEAGERLVEEVARLVPTGPTAFTRPPHLLTTERLDDDLYRIRADATVAGGASWLADALLPSLLKERTPEDLIVHGPVILPTDEEAILRFARAERLRSVRRRSRFVQR
jgi:hypothetical protein